MTLPRIRVTKEESERGWSSNYIKLCYVCDDWGFRDDWERREEFPGRRDFDEFRKFITKFYVRTYALIDSAFGCRCGSGRWYMYYLFLWEEDVWEEGVIPPVMFFRLGCKECIYDLAYYYFDVVNCYQVVSEVANRLTPARCYAGRGGGPFCIVPTHLRV